MACARAITWHVRVPSRAIETKREYEVRETDGEGKRERGERERDREIER